MAADRQLVERIISGAISAAGPANLNNPWQWRQKVQQLIPEVSTMFDERSREFLRTESVLDASHFTGTYLGYKLEESSTRLIVRVDAGQVDRKTGEKVIDEVRTERTDGVFGQRMRATLDSFPVGCTIHCWKINEPLKNNPGHNVRVLLHVVKLAGVGSSTETPRQQPAVPPATSGPVGPSDDGGGEVNDTINRAFLGLSNVKRVMAAHRCREVGIPGFMTATGDDASVVLVIIRDLEENGGS